MPNVYAHYSLGVRALPKMSASHRQTIKDHPRAFALGLQGPDVFFYGSVFRDSGADDFGNLLHAWSGRQVLEKMLSPYGHKPVPPGVKAYLIGFLGHYSLDMTAHPYVYEVQGDMIHHRALETDFDAYLMRLEGHQAPWQSRLDKCLPADQKTQDILVAAYEPWEDLSEDIIRASVKDFRLIRRLMRTPNRLSLGIAQGVMKQMKMYDAFYGMQMPPPSKAFPKGETWPDKPKGAMEELKRLFDDALVLYVKNLTEMEERIHAHSPFSDLFDRNFDGNHVEMPL